MIVTDMLMVHPVVKFATLYGARSFATSFTEPASEFYPLLYSWRILLLFGWYTLLSNSVVSCAVPVGNVSWMLFQEGRSRPHTLVIIPTSSVLEFIRHKQWIMLIQIELYWVQFSGSWIPSLTLTLIVKLHTKLLVTFRGTFADCNWCTRRLLLHSTPHIARAINTWLDHK
jgi:hypothetical protein